MTGLSYDILSVSEKLSFVISASKPCKLCVYDIAFDFNSSVQYNISPFTTQNCASYSSFIPFKTIFPLSISMR